MPREEEERTFGNEGLIREYLEYSMNDGDSVRLPQIIIHVEHAQQQGKPDEGDEKERYRQCAMEPCPRPLYPNDWL